MSYDDAAERSGGNESSKDGPRREISRETPRESWVERLKLALGLKPAASIRDDLEDALEEDTHGTSDEFSIEERRILRNLLAARDVRVADVMGPRGSIVAISEAAAFGELCALFSTAGHSRLPVYGETLDDPKGMIHIRDVFARLGQAQAGETVKIGDFLRPVLFAPGSMPALDLLLDMQAKRIHMALVIDEYGATDGLVSLEDLVEIIVGEIEDEHDVIEDINLVTSENGDITIDARAGIADVARHLGVELDPVSDDHDIETIGGYVTALAGHVPIRGEAVLGPAELRFVILDGDKRRVKRLRIERVAPEAKDGAG